MQIPSVSSGIGSEGVNLPPINPCGGMITGFISQVTQELNAHPSALVATPFMTWFTTTLSTWVNSSGAISSPFPPMPALTGSDLPTILLFVNSCFSFYQQVHEPIPTPFADLANVGPNGGPSLLEVAEGFPEFQKMTAQSNWMAWYEDATGFTAGAQQQFYTAFAGFFVFVFASSSQN